MTTTLDQYDEILSSIERLEEETAANKYESDRDVKRDEQRVNNLYSKMYKEFSKRTEDERNDMEILYSEHRGALTKSEEQVLKIMESVNRSAEAHKEAIATTKILQQWEVEIRNERWQKRSEAEKREREARTQEEYEKTKRLYKTLYKQINEKSQSEIDRLKTLYSNHEDALTSTEREVLRIINHREHLNEINNEQRVHANARAEFEQAKEKAKADAKQRREKLELDQKTQDDVQQLTTGEKERIKTRYSENKALLTDVQKALLGAIEREDEVLDTEAQERKKERELEAFEIRERLESSSVMKFIRHPAKFVGGAIVTGLKNSALGRGISTIKDRVSESKLGVTMGKVNKKLGVTKDALGAFFAGSITGKIGKFLLTGISSKLTSVVSSIFPYKNILDFLMSPVGIALLTFITLWVRIKVWPILKPIYDWIISLKDSEAVKMMIKHPKKTILGILAAYFGGQWMIGKMATSMGAALMNTKGMTSLMGLFRGGAPIPPVGGGASGGLLTGVRTGLATAGTAVAGSFSTAFGATSLGGIAAGGAGAIAAAGTAILAAGAVGVGAGMLLDKAFGISDKIGAAAGGRKERKLAKKEIAQSLPEYEKGIMGNGATYPKLGKYFKIFFNKLDGYQEEDIVRKANLMRFAWKTALKKYFGERNDETAKMVATAPDFVGPHEETVPLPPVAEIIKKELIEKSKPLEKMLPKKEKTTKKLSRWPGVPDSFVKFDPIAGVIFNDNHRSDDDDRIAEVYANYRLGKHADIYGKSEDNIVSDLWNTFYRGKLDWLRKNPKSSVPPVAESPVAGLKNAKAEIGKIANAEIEKSARTKTTADTAKMNKLQATVVKAVDKTAAVTTNIVNNNQVAPVQMTIPESRIAEASPFSYAGG